MKSMSDQGVKQPSPGQHATGILHQRSKPHFRPMSMAIGGLAIAATLGFFVLYSKKKPEASALDVAKVTTGISHPEITRPRH